MADAATGILIKTSPTKLQSFLRCLRLCIRLSLNFLRLLLQQMALDREPQQWREDAPLDQGRAGSRRPPGASAGGRLLQRSPPPQHPVKWLVEALPNDEGSPQLSKHAILQGMYLNQCPGLQSSRFQVQPVTY